MLFFFRKIRRELLASSKFFRYMKYAIGEIILVVLGILIALQIDTWNESRKDEEIKIRYLKQLETEFAQNLELINQSIRGYEIIKTTSSKLLNFTGEKRMEISEKELATILNKSFAGTPRYIPSPSIIQDFINSGILSDLNNDTLRIQLAEWSVILEGAKRREDEIIEQRNALIKLLLLKIPFLHALKIDGSGDLYEPLSYGSNFEGDVRDILNDMEFENRLSFIIVSLLGGDIAYKGIKVHCERILSTIENEIKASKN
ncbi:DUF6090 family protein [Robiginitalea sp. IMCC43444]|uniref:DUF6090 family protein n=1 Tax=Robiginitalea sp. IMCC43444 TaxID=3459121 RepID=UPI004041CD75